MGLLDNWQPGPNTTNAFITGALTGLSTMISSFATSPLFKYYKQQEDLHIKAAHENARRLRIKGDLALRKLEVEHTILQGRNELSAAAGGGRLSGSTLDVLVNNYRYNAIDERTQELETLWAVTEAKRNGYNNAISVASKAVQTAAGQKANALRALTAMGASISSDIAKDKQQEAKNEYLAGVVLNALGQRQGELENKYGTDNGGLNLKSNYDFDDLKLNTDAHSLLKLNEGNGDALYLN